ncbi:glycosyltransferase [Methanosarcina lacustris]|nr:glycosyltransferase [Methanosarcina lacustris]
MNFDQFINKNLLVLTPAYPNGTGTYIGNSFVKNQVNELKRYFKEVIVISPVPFSFEQYPKDKLCDNYSYDNVRVYYPRSFYVPIRYFRKILIDNRLQVIESLIKKENISFDIIHAHFTWPSGYIGVKLKYKYNVPVIITLHANSARFYQEVNMNYPPLIYAWKNADALIRVNQKDVPVLKKFNENTLSIPNGFPSKFKPLDQKECRESLGLPQNVNILFTLGWLIERKGFNYLIEAMDIILKERKDVFCFIGGSGKLKDKLQSQINDLKLERYVKLIGFIPDEVLPLWMGACDIFVLPSLSEGNPTVMFEALGSGRPFVGTDVGGVSEILISEDYGLLFEPRNSTDLANKIQVALETEWNHQKIYEYAQQFTWDNVAKNICYVYAKSGTGM